MDIGHEKRNKNQRFLKTQRLLKRPEYLRLIGKSYCIHGQFFIVRYLPGQTKTSRLGITVTKRVGCAVIRNSVKRLVREYYRCHHRVLLKKSWDINIIVKIKASAASRVALFDELQNLLRRVESTASKRTT